MSTQEARGRAVVEVGRLEVASTSSTCWGHSWAVGVRYNYMKCCPLHLHELVHVGHGPGVLDRRRRLVTVQLLQVPDPPGVGVYKPPFQKSNKISSQIKGSHFFQVKPQIKSRGQFFFKSSHKSNRVVQTFIKSNLKSSHQPAILLKSNLKSNRSHTIFAKSNLKSPKTRLKSSLKSSFKSHKHVKKAVSTNLGHP